MKHLFRQHYLQTKKVPCCLKRKLTAKLIKTLFNLCSSLFSLLPFWGTLNFTLSDCVAASKKMAMKKVWLQLLPTPFDDVPFFATIFFKTNLQCSNDASDTMDRNNRLWSERFVSLNKPMTIIHLPVYSSWCRCLS